MELKDWGQVALICSCVAGLMTIINGIAWFVLRAVFPGREDLRLVASRVDGHDRDLADLRARIAALPTHQDVSAIRTEIAAVGATVNVIADQMRILVEHHVGGGR